MRLTPNRSLNAATSSRAPAPADDFSAATSAFNCFERVVVKQQRVDLHQHFLPLQQLEHAIGDRRRHGRLQRHGRGIGRLQARCAKRLLEHRPRARFLGRERDAMAREREPIAAGDRAGAREIVQHALEQRRMPVRQHALARFLARQTLRERLRRVMRAQQRDDRRRQAIDERRRDEHVADARGEPARDEGVEARGDTRRLDARARHERGDRQPGGARAVHHHRRRADLRLDAVGGGGRIQAAGQRSSAACVRTAVRGGRGSRIWPPAIVIAGE